MREATLALDARGGDAVSEAYLAASLHKRVQALTDDPDTPLFFGRLDLRPDAAPDTGERFYIGRRHVHDDDGDPVVIDWRADVSTAFYRATRDAPDGRPAAPAVRLRARPHHRVRGRAPARPRRDRARAAAILTGEIERPRVGPMRDIVATIQPEQDVIVRADVAQTICVQGAPGTGKTAVGLHRAAYLLYTFRDRLRRGGVLVVGPNSAFLSYISAVLPALGEVDVRQVTLDELVGARVPIRADGAGGGRDAQGRPADGGGAAPRGLRRSASRRASRWSCRAGRGGGACRPTSSPSSSPSCRPATSATARRARCSRSGWRTRCSRKMEEAGESPDDRVQDAVARSQPVRRRGRPALARRRPGARRDDAARRRRTCWPRGRRGCSTRTSSGCCSGTKPARGPKSAPWTLADAVLVDEVADLVDREPSLGHVVLDEAQDLSPMQLRAVGRRCSTGSATVLGDIAQGTTPWATADWASTLRHLGKPDGHVEVLRRGYRVPAAVLDLASRLLPHMAPGVAAAESVRENPGTLDVRRSADPVAAAARRGRRRARPPGLGRRHRRRRRRRRGGRAASASGTWCSAPATRAPRGSPWCRRPWPRASSTTTWSWSSRRAIVAAEPSLRQGLRRLYVVLTRAVTGLTVVHGEPLPEELAA